MEGGFPRPHLSPALAGDFWQKMKRSSCTFLANAARHGAAIAWGGGGGRDAAAIREQGIIST